MIFRAREQSGLVWTSSKVQNVDSGTESHLIMFVNEYKLRAFVASFTNGKFKRSSFKISRVD